MSGDRCVVCKTHARVPESALCIDCTTSWDETDYGDLEWAATRAREAECKKIRKIIEKNKSPDAWDLCIMIDEIRDAVGKEQGG